MPTLWQMLLDARFFFFRHHTGATNISLGTGKANGTVPLTSALQVWSLADLLAPAIYNCVDALI